jgi:hypothetical protein
MFQFPALTPPKGGDGSFHPPGCPIRKSMGHRMRAPRHGLSQLAASFLACPRLGIPRAPLLRLTSSNCVATASPQAEAQAQAEEQLQILSLSRSLRLRRASAASRTGPPVRSIAYTVLDCPWHPQVPHSSNPNHLNCQISGDAEASCRGACLISRRAVYTSSIRSVRQALAAGWKRTAQRARQHRRSGTGRQEGVRRERYGGRGTAGEVRRER